MDTLEITNKEEAHDAVKWNGMALEYVPKKLKTAEVCFEKNRHITIVRYCYLI